MLHSALFLDRDGVINRREVGKYTHEPTEFIFLEGVLDALAILAQKFEFIFVVTNQQGIGKGLMTEAQLTAVHQKMLTEVAQAGGRIDAVYHCPHLETLQCECRKPRTGMALQAQRDFPKVDFNRSIMVGDFLSDIQMGSALGMQTVFVDTAADLVVAQRDKALQLANKTVKGLMEVAMMF